MANKVVLNALNFSQYSYVIPYIRYYAEDKYMNPWHLKKRKIGNYEFVFITKGTGQFCIDGRSYNVKPDDLILFKPNIYHEANSVSLPFEFLCMHFDLYVSNEKKPVVFEQNSMYEDIPDKPIRYSKAILDLPEFMTISNSSRSHLLIKMIINEANQRQAGCNAVIKALFIDLLVHIVREIGDKEQNKRQPDVIFQIINYIKANYMKRILLCDLSKHVHLEPTYVSKLFKKHTGCSITEYLKTYRLSIAKELLTETDCRLDEIAYSVGFYDLHHFSKVFKLEEGIAPSQYRQFKTY